MTNKGRAFTIAAASILASALKEGREVVTENYLAKKIAPSLSQHAVVQDVRRYRVTICDLAQMDGLFVTPANGRVQYDRKGSFLNAPETAEEADVLTWYGANTPLTNFVMCRKPGGNGLMYTSAIRRRQEAGHGKYTKYLGKEKAGLKAGFILTSTIKLFDNKEEK